MLAEFLLDYAKEKHKGLFTGSLNPIVDWHVDQNDDAINGDDWLDNGTSFVWKVGALCVADGNKRDWAYLFVGTQRTDRHDPELTGVLHFDRGENDDCGRVLRRMVECASMADILFHED